MRTAFEDDGSDCMGFMLFFPACHGLHWIDNIFNSLCVFLLLSLLLVVVIIIIVVIIYCYCLNQSTQRQAQKLSVTQTHILLYYIVLCIEQGNHRIYKYIHHIIINNNEMLVIIPRNKIDSIPSLRKNLIERFGDGFN